MEKCLITGATGLIGSRVLKFISDDYNVYVLTNDKKFITSHAYGINYIYQDLSVPIITCDLPNDIDIIIHLAQSEHFREFPYKAIDVFNVNTISTLHLLDYARKIGVKKFIYASSGGIYGTGEHGFKEDEQIVASNNLGFYLGTKLCSEVILRNYSGLMDITILRFFFVYGPGQRKSMLIPRLVEAVKNGIPVELQGEDGIKINPTFVNDAAQAVVEAVSLDGSHLINVAGPDIYSLREIADIIGGYLGVNPVFNVDKLKIPNHLTAHTENMCNLLHAPAIRFEDGIKLVIEEMRVYND